MSWLNRILGSKTELDQSNSSSKPNDTGPWPCDPPRIVEGRYWSVGPVTGIGQRWVIDENTFKLLQQKRRQHEIEQLTADGRLDDPQYYREEDPAQSNTMAAFFNGVSEPRLPIDPDHMPKEIVFKDGAFTGKHGAKLTHVDKIFAPFMISEELHDVLAEPMAETAQFLAIEVVNEEGTRRTRRFIMRPFRAFDAAARLESRFRLYAKPSIMTNEPQTIWQKPHDNEPSELFLRNDICKGACVESRNTPHNLLMADWIVKKLNLHDDEHMICKPHRLVDPWPEPTAAEVFAARGYYDR